MSKGSNIRPRTIPKQQWDKNFDKIFSKPEKKTDSKRTKSDAK